MGRQSGKSFVGLHRVVQPATYVVARGTASFEYFVMAAATTKIPGPAPVTGFLGMHVS